MLCNFCEERKIRKNLRLAQLEVWKESLKEPIVQANANEVADADSQKCFLHQIFFPFAAFSFLLFTV